MEAQFAKQTARASYSMQVGVLSRHFGTIVASQTNIHTLLHKHTHTYCFTNAHAQLRKYYTRGLNARCPLRCQTCVILRLCGAGTTTDKASKLTITGISWRGEKRAMTKLWQRAFLG